MQFVNHLFRKFRVAVITGCLIFGVAMGIGYASDNTIKFAVISDHKSDYTGLQNALTFIVDQQVDFIIVAGDFSPLGEAYPSYYAPSGYEVSGEKEVDMQDVYFVMGNHDKEPDGDVFFQENLAPYYPENGPDDAPRGTIYSFDRGNAHVVVTNQYWDSKEGGYTHEQLDWIEQDLRSSSQPFKFVIGHEPAFPLDRHLGDSLDVDPKMRDTFWDILSDNGVQAFFCGHTHHLSIIENKGVYQIDSGEAVSNHICVVIAEIDDTLAVAQLYETKGSTPEPADDNPFNASLNDNNSGDEAYEVVFSSDIQEDDNFPGCFIEQLRY